jgi:hypothetical protein
MLTMKSALLADGAERLRGSGEFREKLKVLRESVRARYADELRTANFIGRIRLRWRMRTECRRDERRIAPSPQSLYVSHI